MRNYIPTWIRKERVTVSFLEEEMERMDHNARVVPFEQRWD
jgi:hypothetical protein